MWCYIKLCNLCYAIYQIVYKFLEESCFRAGFFRFSDGRRFHGLTFASTKKGLPGK